MPPYVSRNHALTFAQRTRENLLYVKKAYDDGEGVHVVTQLAISLLGLVVFLREKKFDESVRGKGLDFLESQGWPKWQVSLGACNNLGDLVYHLRNAVAHGHIDFDSDSRNIKDVAIEVADYKPNSAVPYWRARIGASDLRAFCFRFLELLEDEIG